MFHLFLLFLSLLSLSQSANLNRWAEAPAEAIGFWRLALTCAVLLPLYFFYGGPKEISRIRKTGARHIWVMVLAGVLFFLHLWTYIYASQYTRIANSMILFSTNPIFVTLGAFFLFGAKVTWRHALAYLLAFGGLAQIFLHSFSLEQQHLFGDSMAVLTAILFAAYVLATSKSRSLVSNTTFSMILYSVTGVLFGVAALIKGVPLAPYPPKTWIAIVLLAVFPTFLGHSLFNYCLKYMEVSTMSNAKLLEPVFSAIVAYWLFQEEVHGALLLAFLLTSAGVVILFMQKRPLPAATQETLLAEDP